MKPAESLLIEQFLSHVSNGLITGRTDSSGPQALQQMAEALGRIAEGENPDIALQIKRKEGGPKVERNWTVAKILRAHEKEHGQMSAGYLDANTWLKANGYKELTDRRLRDILKAHRAELQRLEAIQAMIEKTNEAIAGEPRTPE